MNPSYSTNEIEQQQDTPKSYQGQHIAVLEQTIQQLSQQYLATTTPRLLDVTLGGGGHSAMLLNNHPQSKLWASDRDPQALETARLRLAPYKERITLRHGRFSELAMWRQSGELPEVDLLIADFGVSSFQLDHAERGFSFRHNGPLDMRMDPQGDPPLSELLEQVDSKELSKIIWQWGEERYAKSIARAIIQKKPTDLRQLVHCIEGAVPPAYRHGRLHAATRTFQALRIWVNAELREIEDLLALLPKIMAPSGLVFCISFHSLEDRRVKQAFQNYADPCQCPPQLAICLCGKTAFLKPLNKRPLQANAEEITNNPRSRSALLRLAQVLPLTNVPLKSSKKKSY